ncbi:uncharacterized protein LOC100904915 [Galendromus occidentalis]|uniref:Uncharacterized protein LOC100904915 n=1 Tax=Galendromus occidentalis TaxID=34638 RepID=A0AAJ6W016_9ACAR|nr:uncharacterized protein LOC100904915 [Galendromus occidentalis]
MKLRGLPVELRPGPVDLLPAGKKCVLLQPCSLCKLHHRTYFICEDSHITCTDCFLSDQPLTRANRHRSEGYCKRCDTQMTMFRVEIPLHLLQNLEFKCTCGFIGKLVDIKRHVKSGDFSQKCCGVAEEPGPCTDEFDVEMAKLDTLLSESVTEFEDSLVRIKEQHGEKFANGVKRVLDPKVYGYEFSVNSSMLLGLVYTRLKDLHRDLVRLRRASMNVTPIVQDLYQKLTLTQG